MIDTINKKELSVREIYMMSFKLYTKYFAQLFCVSMVWLFIFDTIGFLLLPEYVHSKVHYLNLFLTAGLGMFVALFLNIANALFIKSVLDKKIIRPMDALKKASLFYGSSVTTALIKYIFTIPLYLLLFIPGFIFALYTIFSSYAVIFDNQVGLNALQYSKKLVDGKVGKIFLLIFIQTCVAIVLNILAGKVITILLILFTQNSTFDKSLVNYGKHLINTFWVVYFQISTIIMFLNLRYLKYSTK